MAFILGRKRGKWLWVMKYWQGIHLFLSRSSTLWSPIQLYWLPRLYGHSKELTSSCCSDCPILIDFGFRSTGILQISMRDSLHFFSNSWKFISLEFHNKMMCHSKSSCSCIKMWSFLILFHVNIAYGMLLTSIHKMLGLLVWNALSELQSLAMAWQATRKLPWYQENWSVYLLLPTLSRTISGNLGQRR